MSYPDDNRLTIRQLQVVCHLANGLTAQETAEAMALSISTVKQTLLTCRQKVGARTTPQLVSIVIRHGDLVWTEDDDERKLRESQLCGPAGG